MGRPKKTQTIISTTIDREPICAKEEIRMNNQIIDVQSMLFREMERLSDDRFLEFTDSKKANNEFARCNALYNMATGYIKSINANIKIMELAKREGKRTKDMIEYLGLSKND